MLKGKFVGQYRSSRTGNLVFKYDISGKAEDVQDYEESKGTDIRHNEESGSPLFFTVNYDGDNIKLIKTQPQDGEGEWIVDTSEVDKLQNLAQRYPELKDHIAARMVDELLNASKKPSTSASTASKAEASEEEGDLGGM